MTGLNYTIPGPWLVGAFNTSAPELPVFRF